MRKRQEVATELAGIWKQETREEALLNLNAFKAKYQKRYPEAIRSLVEDEEHLLTFYAFPPVMHRYIRSTNAIESFFIFCLVRGDKRACDLVARPTEEWENRGLVRQTVEDFCEAMHFRFRAGSHDRTISSRLAVSQKHLKERELLWRG